MTAWTTISNALVAVGAKPFATTVQALRDNPAAIAEGATGAPVLSTGWHPYDMVNVGDGATGKFYDFAVNGAVTSITTPTFADGYDYFIRFVGLSTSNGAGGQLRVGGVIVSGIVAAASSVTGFIEIIAPTLTNFPKVGKLHFRETAGSTGIAAQSTAAGTPFNGDFNFGSMASALTSTTLDFVTFNFDAGQVYLYRRRNFMFG